MQIDWQERRHCHHLALNGLIQMQADHHYQDHSLHTVSENAREKRVQTLCHVSFTRQ
jgi:hypothetical protein